MVKTAPGVPPGSPFPEGGSVGRAAGGSVGFSADGSVGRVAGGAVGTASTGGDVVRSGDFSVDGGSAVAGGRSGVTVEAEGATSPDREGASDVSFPTGAVGSPVGAVIASSFSAAPGAVTAGSSSAEEGSLRSAVCETEDSDGGVTEGRGRVNRITPRTAAQTTAAAPAAANARRFLILFARNSAATSSDRSDSRT